MDYVENSHDTGERIKHLWSKYGNAILTIVIAVMVIIVGLQYWHKHEVKVAAQASEAYERLVMSVTQKNKIETQALTNKLMTQYKNSPYATFAALLAAKQAAQVNNFSDASDKLNWIIKHSKVKSFKIIAKLRLAQIFLANNKANNVLQLLQNIKNKAFLGKVDFLRGNAYVQLKQTARAKSTYEMALQQLTTTSPLYHYVQMKLYSL